jgi:hypothetical protein
MLRFNNTKVRSYDKKYNAKHKNRKKYRVCLSPGILDSLHWYPSGYIAILSEQTERPVLALAL